MNDTTTSTTEASPELKAVMNWGYDHRLYLTEAQAADLLKALATT